jgi:hypothetical protein
MKSGQQNKSDKRQPHMADRGIHLIQLSTFHIDCILVWTRLHLASTWIARNTIEWLHQLYRYVSSFLTTPFESLKGVGDEHIHPNPTGLLSAHVFFNAMTAKAGASNGDSGTTFPPALVTETLQYRLDTGNIAKQGGQRGSLTRCAQKFGIFQSNLLASQPDAAAIETAKQDLSQDLDMCKLELYKLILLQRNLDAQMELNQEAQDGRTAEIDRWSEEVRSSRSEASQAQDMKRCFQEYEALAKLTNENHPQSAWALKEKLSKVEEQIEKLKQEETETGHLMKVREGQFQLLIQYMLDFKRSLNDTEEDAKLLELAKKAKRQGNDNEEGAKSKVTKSSVNKAEAMDVDKEDEGLYEDL